MTLREATSEFLKRAGPIIFPDKQSLEACARSLELLKTYFAHEKALSEIAPAELRDFLARWYIEKSASISFSLAPQILCDSLEFFFKWAEEAAALDDAKQHLQLLAEVRLGLPRALEITALLTR